MSAPEGLHLGARLDPATGQRTEEAVRLRFEDLTTHGVIVGMTGSGKTGLGIVLLEEVLASGRPALLVDPKGDLADLALLFPGLSPEEFRPWVDPAEARREGVGEDELAARTAERWRTGLAGWGLGGEDIRRLKEGISLRVYTPGSTAGAPLNLVGSLGAPRGADEETRRDAAEELVSGLLTLAGMEADPLTSPEHILLANLVEHAWGEGRDLELEGLIAGVQSPPFRKLGVFELDTFLPPSARMKLALRLNGLVASPSFATWRAGDPLDMDALLHAPDGRPRASIVQLGHLSESERMFVVTLLLSRAVSWMRGQSGTSGLRALVYVDELFGFAPPTAQPSSKKPLLTLFKQARAHGLGVVVSTQNPVDLDYKLMSNAGTWMVGRLQTERDKARILEALQAADGRVDVAAWDARIGELGKRHFLLKEARSPEPTLFTTRWAMAYLRGPITRAELDRLPSEVVGEGGEAPAGPKAAPGEAPPGPASTAAPGSGSAEAAADDDESPVAPRVAEGVPVRYVDPAAPWARELGLGREGARLRAGLAARLRLLFDEERAGLRHEEVWEAVAFPLGETFRPEDARAVDYDDRDLRKDAPPGARYVLPRAPLDRASFFRDAESALVDHLYRSRTLTLLRNPELKLVSRVDEGPEAFRERCRRAASDRADREAAVLRERYTKKLDVQQEQADRAGRRVRELEADVSARRQQEMVAGAGQLLSMFLGGRRRASSLSGIASRRSTTRRTEERLTSAEERLRDELEDVRDLEEELGRELEEIVRSAAEAAGGIEELPVGLEKGDIRVDELVVIWG